MLHLIFNYTGASQTTRRPARIMAIAISGVLAISVAVPDVARDASPLEHATFE
jgi:hypothetical protein